jgi:hypothetical protein
LTIWKKNRKERFLFSIFGCCFLSAVFPHGQENQRKRSSSKVSKIFLFFFIYNKKQLAQLLKIMVKYETLSIKIIKK